MKTIVNSVIKALCLFGVGGSTYIGIETIWRLLRGSHPTHWSMFVLGGIVFVLIGGINEHIAWEVPFALQVTLGTLIVVLCEFVAGCILNLWLGLGIWDYSEIPMNLLGQICLPFGIAWVPLSAAAIVIDDYLRYWLFDEEKPRYY